MTDVGSQGLRGRRKSTYVAGAVVLLIVAAMLAAAAFVTGTGAMLWVAVALGVVALLLIPIGQRVRRTPPSHPDHPRLTHGEDHPKDQDTP
jgi:hypothetical protein